MEPSPDKPLEQLTDEELTKAVKDTVEQIGRQGNPALTEAAVKIVDEANQSNKKTE